MNLKGQQISFSDEYIAMTNQERDLNALADAGKTPKAELREMYQALADRYLDEGHKVAAERCQKKADRLAR